MASPPHKARTASGAKAQPVLRRAPFTLERATSPSRLEPAEAMFLEPRLDAHLAHGNNIIDRRVVRVIVSSLFRTVSCRAATIVVRRDGSGKRDPCLTNGKEIRLKLRCRTRLI